jgi:hypothetical protein
MTNSRTRTTVLGFWVFMAASNHLAHAQPTGGPGDRFVPMGHSYDSSNRPMPTLNSYEDQIENRADAIETEIYRKQRQRAYWEHQLNATHGTYLGAEPRWPPGY